MPMHPALSKFRHPVASLTGRSASSPRSAGAAEASSPSEPAAPWRSRYSLPMRLSAGAFALLSLGGVGLAPTGVANPPRSDSSVVDPVIAAPTAHSVGRYQILDHVDGETSGLTRAQTNAYRILSALLERHASLSETSPTDLPSKAEEAQAVAQQVEVLLHAAYPPAEEPSAQVRHGLGMDPANVKRITPHALERIAAWADSVGLPLGNLELLFLQGQAPAPRGDDALATSFFAELAGKQYAELVPFRADGQVDLPEAERGVRNLLLHLDPGTRGELRRLVGYTGAPEGTDAREQEVHLQNEVTTPELIGSLVTFLRGAGIDPATLAGGADEAQARGVVDQLRAAMNPDPSLSFLGQVSKRWVDTGLPGVRYLQFSANGNYRGHIVEIDKSLPQYNVRVTRPGERGQTVSQFAQNTGAYIAVNGDFWNIGAPGQQLRPDGSPFSWNDFQPIGLAVGEGEHWAHTGDSPGHLFMACDANDQCTMDTPGTAQGVNPAWKSVVGGNAMLVQDGQRVIHNDAERHPRTAVGLSRYGNKLILVVIEGRRPDARGATLDELSAIMEQMNAQFAMNGDGGGSSALYISTLGGRVSQTPSGSGERTDANHLAIVPG